MEAWGMHFSVTVLQMVCTSKLVSKLERSRVIAGVMQIVTLDRGFTLQSSFQAHAYALEHVLWLEVRKHTRFQTHFRAARSMP